MTPFCATTPERQGDQMADLFSGAAAVRGCADALARGAPKTRVRGPVNRLSARKVATVKEAGFYCDGGGLYLAVGPNSRSWVFRYTPNGRRRDMGLGVIACDEARRQVIRTRSKHEARHISVEREARSRTSAWSAKPGPSQRTER
jgi:hypothetical protein